MMKAPHSSFSPDLALYDSCLFIEDENGAAWHGLLKIKANFSPAFQPF
jgi:hypothetical protein